jgi:hypothetical protein
MDYTNLRKLSLKVFLGFLGLTAIIAIISVLSGEFGELQMKVLATSLTISAASICSMSCAAFIEKKSPKELGMSGILLSVVAAGLLIAGVWLEPHNDEYWKTAVTFVIAAVAFAHAFLLVLPTLDATQKWVQRVSTVTIGMLALQIAVAVWGEINNEGYYRCLAVVAIIVGLETLAIPMLMKLRKSNAQEKLTLVLEKLEDDIYRDTTGKQYQLREIIPEQIDRNNPA